MCYPTDIQNYYKGAYCNENYVLKDDITCAESVKPGDDSNCQLTQFPFKCVSDVNLHTNKGKISYMTDSDCSKYKDNKSCMNSGHCISIPSSNTYNISSSQTLNTLLISSLTKRSASK